MHARSPEPTGKKPNLKQEARVDTGKKKKKAVPPGLGAAFDDFALSSDDEPPDSPGFQRPKTMLSYLTRQFGPE